MTDYSQLSRHDLITRLRAAEAELERIQATGEVGNGQEDFGSGVLAASTELRRRAKARLQSLHAQSERTLEVESLRLIHELRVHQIELESQNEELQAVRAQLEQSLKRYTDLYDSAPVGYFTVTGNGTIRELNLTGAALIGQARSYLIGGRLGLWMTKDSRPVFAAFLSRLVQGGCQEACEVTLDRDGAPLRQMCLKGMGVGSGMDRSYHLVMVDITERKRAEQELIARETLLRTIMENSPDPIFMVDRACRVLYVNPASLTVLNSLGRWPPWTQEALVGKMAPEFFSDPAVGRAMLESDQRAMESGQEVRVEERITTLGGAQIYLSIRSPLRDTAGRIVGLVGIAHDITKQKRDEAERLDRLERQRDALVREVHHRIKNHLQGIVGLLRNRIAESSLSVPPLEEIIVQIGAIAHVYGLQSHSVVGGVWLDELLETLIRSMSDPSSVHFSRTPESGIAVFLAGEEAVPLALVLNELLTNALKHNDPSKPCRPVRVALDIAAAELWITIRNGPAGLPAVFDFAAGRGLGTGLELLRTLLPLQGALLTFVSTRGG